MPMENNSLTAIIYSINQKGRSQGIIIRDLEIGKDLRQTGKIVFFPIFLFALFIILLRTDRVIVLRTFSHQIGKLSNENLIHSDWVAIAIVGMVRIRKTGNCGKG